MRASIRAMAIGSLAGVAATLAPGNADANILINSFSGTCGTTLICIGSADEAGDALRLTTSGPDQGGAAYTSAPVMLGPGGSFNTAFTFRLGNPGGFAPADGITFFIAADPAGLGDYGGSMGYEGAGRSIAVEFDTYDNGEAAGANHVAVNTNGALNNLAAFHPYGATQCDAPAAGCLANGDIWTVQINYDGATQHLSVAVQDGTQAPHQGIHGLDIDIAGILGTTSAYLGFGGGTGGGHLQQDILGWSLSATPQPANDIPEPATLALLATGVLVLAGTRRRTAA